MRETEKGRWKETEVDIKLQEGQGLMGSKNTWFFKKILFKHWFHARHAST